ncbi:MAG: glycosyl hydrolase [Saprospiraceae bacterium]
MLKSIALTIGLLPVLLFAQSNFQQPPATAAADRIESFNQRKQLEQQSIVNGVAFRSVGPTVFSGRVVDIDVSPTDPSHFYVAYASGGLMKTENNGITFTPIFDKEAVLTTGAVAVDWKNNVIWLGTGEVNSSRSSYAGAGMYKSTDGGKTWQHLGLGESHHIGRIVLHPKDPNTAWVAVLGHLYSPNKERGIYKTTDGGKTWKQTLFVNEKSGAIDLILDPKNPKVLYAASWQRERSAWDFVEAGEGSGIYKSTDGGNKWELLSTPSSGLPVGEGMGRIGLTMTYDNGKAVLYTSIDNYNRRPKEEPKDDELTKDMLREMSKEDFVKLESYKLKDYLQQNRFPRKYSAEAVLKMVKEDKITPKTLVEYTEDANSLLFDSPVIGLEIYRSDNGGKNWVKTHEGYQDFIYSSYGYYFGTIRVAPGDANKVYMLGVPIIRSDNGGKTFKSIDGDNVHSDHHSLWVNPNRKGHLINGNDGGINISYDDGENWIKCNAPAVGQFYYVAVDMAQPYNVYGGLQDNGVWMGPSTYEASTRWHGSGQYPYKSIMGGDGMQVAIDTRDNATVYTGLQFGVYFRLNTQTGSRKAITPVPELGDRPYRWNWQTPIHLSVHNQDIFYMGSERVHRSLNQGDDFEAISGDLTTGGRKGDVAFSTLTTIHESPLSFGLLYVGSDDGLVHVTKNGGADWINISEGLPKDMWVSRIQASAHEKGRVYVVLNGYRWDDFRAMAYVSEDYGKTWQAIGKDLPLEPLNVIKEDPDNADILYVGSDHGLYVSLDRGQSFMLMNNGLPAVAIHDLVIHPREKDMIVGTHGRSMYIGSVKELQQLKPELLAKAIHAFGTEKIRQSGFWGRSSIFRSSEPSVSIPIYANSAGKASISIQTKEGITLQSFEADLVKGLNYPSYDLTIQEGIISDYLKPINEKIKKGEKPVKIEAAENKKFYIYKGEYTVKISKGGDSAETKLVIE